MKTKEEIFKYLEEQTWYSKFKTLVEYEQGMDFNDFISDEIFDDKADSIIYSFRWSCTEEGYEYWFKVEENYLKWLNNEN